MRTNLGWIIIFANLFLTYFMGIVVLKDLFTLIKAIFKLILKITLIILRKSQF